MKKIIIILFSVLIFTSPALGLTKYGDATIKKGYLTVVRGGKNLKFSDTSQTHVILNKDVLKVGDDSLVTLKTIQDSIVQMGSNAVFQVRPWKHKKRKKSWTPCSGKLWPSNFCAVERNKVLWVCALLEE